MRQLAALIRVWVSAKGKKKARFNPVKYRRVARRHRHSMSAGRYVCVGSLIPAFGTEGPGTAVCPARSRVRPNRVWHTRNINRCRAVLRSCSSRVRSCALPAPQALCLRASIWPSWHATGSRSAPRSWGAVYGLRTSDKVPPKYATRMNLMYCQVCTWAQGVAGSNAAAPTTFSIRRSHIGHKQVGPRDRSKCDLQQTSERLVRSASH